MAAAFDIRAPERLLALGLLLGGSLWAQAPAENTPERKIAGHFETAAQAIVDKRYCDAAAAYADAGKTAADLNDRTKAADAQFTAAIDVAGLAKDCTTINEEESYARAKALARTNAQRAIVANSYALFLFSANRRDEAITELAKIESELVANGGNAGTAPGFALDRQDLAVYEYNLGTIYASAPTDQKAALAEFRRALWNRPGYSEASEAAFRILRTRPPDVALAIEGAELTGLIQITGFPLPAVHEAIELLNVTANDPQAEVLLGAVLKCLLVLPIDTSQFGNDWNRLLEAGENASKSSPKFAAAVQQLDKAYRGEIPLPLNATDAAREFSAWVEEQLFVVPLSALLVRRGVALQESNSQATLSFYATAWSLNPSDTSLALLLAGLLSSHPDLDKDCKLTRSMLSTYIPPVTRLQRLAGLLSPPSASEDFQHTQADWLNIKETYKLLAPLLKEIPDAHVLGEIEARANDEARRAGRPDAARPVQAFVGDRVIRGVVPDGAETDGVYIEIVRTVDTRLGRKREEIRENALANVEKATGRYSATLLRDLSADDTIRVYAIRLGEQSENPIVPDQRAQSRGFANLRHVRTYFDFGDDSQIGRPISNLAGAFSITGEGTFRPHNHGEPYLPHRGSYLISSFASFSLAPFSLTSASRPLVQVSNARSFEGGLYMPWYLNYPSFYFLRDFYSSFLAPIAKTGFHAAGTNEGRVLYKYGAAGVRMGFYRFARYGEKVPELKGFLDVTAGKWQNLEVFSNGRRNLPLRMEVKGQFSILGTAAFVGFLRTAGPGPNDFRLFLGLRFDLSYPLARILKID